MDYRSTGLRQVQGWNAKPRGTTAALRAVQAEILRRTEHEQRKTGLTPGGAPGLVRPCNRCGREQPRGQSPADIAAYAALEPTAVLYTRTDGCVRAHDAGCDLLPHPPPLEVPEVDPEDRPLIRHDSSGLSYGCDGKPTMHEPTPEKWAEYLKARGWR